MKPHDVDIDDYHKTVQRFHEETDRAAAVLAGSYMENYLVKFIKHYTITDKDSNNWFDRDGPFSTFYQRITTAYAFKLIPESIKKDLTYICKIRNHFAHHPFDASFDESPVIDWLCHLNYPQTDIEALEPTNREKYLLTISMCIVRMHNVMAKNNAKCS